MTCEFVEMPGVGVAIVCGGRRSRKKCECGRAAGLECDWKVPERKSGTCDKPICSRCATSPAPGKDLCREHAARYEAWKRAKRQRELEL